MLFIWELCFSTGSDIRTSRVLECHCAPKLSWSNALLWADECSWTAETMFQQKPRVREPVYHPSPGEPANLTYLESFRVVRGPVSQKAWRTEPEEWLQGHLLASIHVYKYLSAPTNTHMSTHATDLHTQVLYLNSSIRHSNYDAYIGESHFNSKLHLLLFAFEILFLSTFLKHPTKKLSIDACNAVLITLDLYSCL